MINNCINYIDFFIHILLNDMVYSCIPRTNYFETTNKTKCYSVNLKSDNNVQGVLYVKIKMEKLPLTFFRGLINAVVQFSFS